jgi:hypothetical protein
LLLLLLLLLLSSTRSVVWAPGLEVQRSASEKHSAARHAQARGENNAEAASPYTTTTTMMRTAADHAKVCSSVPAQVGAVPTDTLRNSRKMTSVSGASASSARLPP